MPSNITPFAFDDALVRTVSDDNGNSWFVAKDVALALGYEWNGSARIAHVPMEWRGGTSVVTPFGTQEMLTLSEQGLYFFLGRSDKPKALPFQKWLAGEVLPALRRTGTYTVPGLTVASELPTRSSLDVILKGLQSEIAGIPRRQVEKGINYALQMARVVGVIDPDELAGAIVASCRLMIGKPRREGEPLEFPNSISSEEAELVRDFVDTACERNPGYECGSRKLWLAFRAWCKDAHGIAEKSCVSNKAMSIVLMSMGIRRKRIRPTTIFTGILPDENWRHA